MLFTALHQITIRTVKEIAQISQMKIIITITFAPLSATEQFSHSFLWLLLQMHTTVFRGKWIKFRSRVSHTNFLCWAVCVHSPQFWNPAGSRVTMLNEQQQPGILVKQVFRLGDRTWDVRLGVYKDQRVGIKEELTMRYNHSTSPTIAILYQDTGILQQSKHYTTIVNYTHVCLPEEHKIPVNRQKVGIIF